MIEFQGTCYFDLLPNELIEEIIIQVMLASRFLTKGDLLSLSMSCNRVHRLAEGRKVAGFEAWMRNHYTDVQIGRWSNSWNVLS